MRRLCSSGFWSNVRLGPLPERYAIYLIILLCYYVVYRRISACSGSSNNKSLCTTAASCCSPCCVCDETVVVHSDNDDDDDRQSHCAEENDIADLRCEQVVNTPNVAQMQDSRDDADEDDASDLDDGPPSKRVRSDRFLTVDEVLQLLSSHETVLPAVPRGYKRDARFLVNNEDNVQKSSRKKSFLG